MADSQKLLGEVVKICDMARAKQKFYYDKKRREFGFKVRDKVLKIKHCLSCATKGKVGRVLQ